MYQPSAKAKKLLGVKTKGYKGTPCFRKRGLGAEGDRRGPECGECPWGYELGSDEREKKNKITRRGRGGRCRGMSATQSTKRALG